MKIGIAFKLFCALLGAGIVMAAAMGVASRISFQRGFLGYLNDLESQRLAVLTATLADVYEEHGDWTFLRGEEDEWRRIVRTSDRSFRQARDAGQASAAPAAKIHAPQNVAAAVPSDTANGTRFIRKTPSTPDRSLQPDRRRSCVCPRWSGSPGRGIPTSPGDIRITDQTEE